MLKRFGLLLFLMMLLVPLTLAQEDDESEPEPFAFVATEDGPLVMAHAGGIGLGPANTMVTFEKAVEIGVDVLEMDIHITSDDVIVTIHDDTVDRTTDGTGLVREMTFADLQALDAGYNWTDQRGEYEDEFPYRGQGITHAALSEVFEAFPEMPMVIEIKQAEPSMVEPFCDLLTEYEMQDQVLVASFSDDTLLEFREACPGIQTSSAEQEIRLFVGRLQFGSLDDYEAPSAAFQVPEFFGDLQVVTPEFVEAAQAVGIGVHVWTINDSDDMARMIDLGVDGIITDYPDETLRLLGRLDGAGE